MALAVRSIGAVKTATTGNLASIALGAGHVLNDINFLCFDEDSNVPEGCTGYTQLGTVTNGANQRASVWAKRDNGAEAAPTITRALGGDATAFSVCCSGVDSGLTIGTVAGAILRDIQSQTGTGDLTPSFNVTGAALTGGVSGDLNIFFGSFVATGDTAGDPAPVWTPPAGFTERLDNVWAVDLSGISNTFADVLASGSIGSCTATTKWESTVSPKWVGWHMALSSAASGGATFVADPIRERLNAVRTAAHW